MAILKFFDRIYRHMDLMDRMMDVVGVNNKLKTLPDAPGVLRRAVLRCQTCDNTEECQSFLDANSSADEAPVYCRNHDLFARLKREIEADKAVA